MNEPATSVNPQVDEEGPSWTARAMLPPDPGAPVAARRLVSTLFMAWGLADQVEVAELVVSELVSNSVRHAGTPVTWSSSWSATGAACGCRSPTGPRSTR